MGSESKSITARLRRAVAASVLSADASQVHAARQLDRLALDLRAHQSPLQRLRDLLGAFGARPSQRPVKGVYLWGGVGRGKTLLMDLFVDELSGVALERTHFYRFMRSVHAELRDIKDHSDPLAVVAERLTARVRVICLDEFFVSDIADAMLLAGLFAGLFSRGVALVATSNVAPVNLYRDGLQRQRFLSAITLIERHVQVVNLEGSVDYRLRQLEQAPTYLDSADPGTAGRLRQQFTAMAGGAMQGPNVITVEDRPIQAQALGPGLAWFAFADLCEGPRSQNDYIDLARLYHTIFIADVPVFTPLSEDAARRFIMLIDEFYDRGVNLVLSAAAPPTQLYQGEKLTFEFERAASRLIEMQTEAYLAGEHRP